MNKKIQLLKDYKKSNNSKFKFVKVYCNLNKISLTMKNKKSNMRKIKQN